MYRNFSSLIEKHVPSMGLARPREAFIPLSAALPSPGLDSADTVTESVEEIAIIAFCLLIFYLNVSCKYLNSKIKVCITTNTINRLYAEMMSYSLIT